MKKLIEKIAAVTMMAAVTGCSTTPVERAAASLDRGGTLYAVYAPGESIAVAEKFSANAERLILSDKRIAPIRNQVIAATSAATILWHLSGIDEIGAVGASSIRVDGTRLNRTVIVPGATPKGMIWRLAPACDLELDYFCKFISPHTVRAGMVDLNISAAWDIVAKRSPELAEVADRVIRPQLDCTSSELAKELSGSWLWRVVEKKDPDTNLPIFGSRVYQLSLPDPDKRLYKWLEKNMDGLVSFFNELGADPGFAHEDGQLIVLSDADGWGDAEKEQTNPEMEKLWPLLPAHRGFGATFSASPDGAATGIIIDRGDSTIEIVSVGGDDPIAAMLLEAGGNFYRLIRQRSALENADGPKEEAGDATANTVADQEAADQDAKLLSDLKKNGKISGDWSFELPPRADDDNPKLPRLIVRRGAAFGVRFANGSVEVFRADNADNAKKIVSFLHTVNRYSEEELRYLIRLADNFDRRQNHLLESKDEETE